jgi:hypothetical protein
MASAIPRPDRSRGEERIEEMEGGLVEQAPGDLDLQERVVAETELRGLAERVVLDAGIPLAPARAHDDAGRALGLRTAHLRQQVAHDLTQEHAVRLHEGRRIGEVEHDAHGRQLRIAALLRDALAHELG